VKPDSTAASTGLAWLLATSVDDNLRDGDEATKLAADACRHTGNRDPKALDALAAAHAESARFEQALAAAELAHTAARSAGRLRSPKRSSAAWSATVNGAHTGNEPSTSPSESPRARRPGSLIGVPRPGWITSRVEAGTVHRPHHLVGAPCATDENDSGERGRVVAARRGTVHIAVGRGDARAEQARCAGCRSAVLRYLEVRARVGVGMARLDGPGLARLSAPRRRYGHVLRVLMRAPAGDCRPQKCTLVVPQGSQVPAGVMQQCPNVRVLTPGSTRP